MSQVAPLTTPEHKPPRRRARRAVVLAASALIAAPLLAGAATPAMAEDGNTYFTTEQQVLDFLNQSAPLNQKEAVKGYPASGQDSQEVKLDDVEKVYPHDQALKDVPDKLGSAFNLPPTIPTEGPDIRNSSRDDKEPWLSNWDAKSMCGQPSHNPGGEQQPCGFVGVLDKAYPVMQTSASVMGKAQFSYKTQATVGQDTSQTSGWSVGGKVSSELTTPGGPGGGKAGSELNFTYSESTTTTNKWTTMTEQTNTYDVPDGVSGRVEGRANGGWYIGYNVYKLDFTDGDGNRKQKMVLIPARVLIQAPGNSSPLTYVKRG
ncbi:hypothetical protein [Streptomyces natalensis]|uniref:Uncharacterized protein n=1 Tax=Streptomyces natalensis ATCC 27448 TaxID=1240678 RepID=A0A0D7CNK1_9ACTN|nr:hypothetical protein [Streptomyces natalensis]KIZ17002.1 hypothetical protein SNA_18785 [Streptomyces natalensis ATCC 27448]